MPLSNILAALRFSFFLETFSAVKKMAFTTAAEAIAKENCPLNPLSFLEI